MMNIGVLISGGGTNLQALIDAQKSGMLKSGKITDVVSNRSGAYGLVRARTAGIRTAVITKKECGSSEEFDKRICEYMKEHKIDLIIMAGFLAIVGKNLLSEFKDKIINVHPSLIPSFCGDGFYGLKVHEAALEYGVKVTGATVHFVNEVTDGGKIILQKAVYIQENDTPETLQKRVMQEAEWVILPQAAELFCSGKLSRKGERTT
ncbi:MAG: phosphoribosylglycinamide formyltransferase [Oscillospiraceae bacterium]|nr:phosphoribosylglycinamide formyltransferase [Oscillospiraceae bacterium]